MIGEIFPNFGRDNRKLQLTIIDSILNACKGRGRVVVKWAYGDAIRYKDLRPDFHQRAVDMKDTPPHQRAALSDGGKSWVVPPKNSADIKMVVDAMELAYTNEHIDTYVLASGDSDFTPILSKLRELGKHTIVISLPERLSWRLEEYSDETLSLTELFRNRKINDTEYNRALSGIYAGYEFENKFSDKFKPCHNGGPKFLPVSVVKHAMEFLGKDSYWEDEAKSNPSRYLNSNQQNISSSSQDDSDLEWVLNTKDAAEHIQILRGSKGKQFLRPMHFDPTHTAPGPSWSTPGGLNRKDRLRILEMKLKPKDIMPPSLRHVSAPVAFEVMTTQFSWTENEGVKKSQMEKMGASAKVRMRGSVISQISTMTTQYLKERDLPKLGNRHVRQLVDLAIASGALVVTEMEQEDGEEDRVDIDSTEDPIYVYQPAPGLVSYKDFRAKVDVHIMKTVLFGLEHNSIVPDGVEWFCLLYNEERLTNQKTSSDEKIESKDYKYLKKMENRAREEYQLEQDGLNVEEEVVEELGFFAKLFGR